MDEIPELAFVERVGNWPAPECAIYSDGRRKIARYDYALDLWTFYDAPHLAAAIRKGPTP